MHSRWLTIVLVFSVTINVAVLGTLIYYWSSQKNDRPIFMDQHGPGPPMFEFGLEAEQQDQIRSAMGEFRQEMKGLQDSLKAKRQMILELMLDGETHTQQLDNALEELAAYQVKLERATIEHLLEMRPILGPERWEHLVRAIETRMPLQPMHRFRDKPRRGRWKQFPPADTMINEQRD